MYLIAIMKTIIYNNNLRISHIFLITTWTLLNNNLFTIFTPSPTLTKDKIITYTVDIIKK